ncbi:hypothetical protein ANAPC5_01382 [Anaplasma phagocytophilum]|nr:hypothetical protein ANAPC5_01382 [Anaplasma phagocytophilum]
MNAPDKEREHMPTTVRQVVGARHCHQTQIVTSITGGGDQPEQRIGLASFLERCRAPTGRPAWWAFVAYAEAGVT